MGDPKKQKKKYSTPNHPWNKERILSEKKIQEEYGLKRKNEIWKMDSLLRKLQSQAKTIIGTPSKQSEVEKKNLLKKIYNLGLLPEGSRIGDTLNLQLKDILERRLQTLVVRRKLANTMLQARQFIAHRNILVGNKKITSPSHLVNLADEPKITHIGKTEAGTK